MSEYIECKRCDSQNCRGCNINTLSKMLNKGKFDCVMDEHHCINPNADVVDVRHGYWKMRGGWFRCSVCDGKALLQDVGGTGGFSHEYEQVRSTYCPHCLAKMDGKGEGE